MEIFQATPPEHNQHVRELFWEYLVWANAMLRQEFDISFDIKAMLEQDMVSLDQFLPPAGRLLLAQDADLITGLACLRKIGEDTGEIKRMYVRPSFRGRGIGKALVNALIEEARQLGYAKVRLDSAKFMKAAHAMYQSCGFTEIDPYPESEIPPDFQPNWLFMELVVNLTRITRRTNMSIESNKALALRWHNEVLNQRKFHLIEEVIHPDYVNHDANIHGLAAAKETFTQMMASGSTRVNTEDLIAEGDKVMARWTNYEGDRMTYKGITIWRILDGKIIEDWFCAEEIKPA